MLNASFLSCLRRPQVAAYARYVRRRHEDVVTKRTAAALGVVGVAVVAIGWLAWTWWPPLLEYRIRQIDRRTLTVVQDYLDGKHPLEPSAKVLAALWQKKETISLRLVVPGEMRRIEDPLARFADRANDPRLKKLVDSASHLASSGRHRARPQQDSM